VQVRDARRDEIERVLRAARSGRGGGPALDDSIAFDRALLESPWGREHERFVVGCDGEGRLLAALKLRSLEGALDGRPVRIAHVEAAFPLGDTGGPELFAELRDETLRQAHGRGHALAILIPPAGGADLASHGFRALPCSETACRTFLPAPWPKEPAWLRAGESAFGRVPGLRPGRPEDIDDLAAIHTEEIAGQRLRTDRDRGAWEQIFLARGVPGRPGGARDPFWVIERGGRVEAYVLLQALPPMLRWREHGARRGAETLLADLFWSALGRARQERLPRIEGWRMPEVLTLEPLYPTSTRRRKVNLAMLKMLDPVSPAPKLEREDDCRLWELDLVPAD